MKITPKLYAKVVWIVLNGTERSYQIASEQDLDRIIKEIEDDADANANTT